MSTPSLMNAVTRELLLGVIAITIDDGHRAATAGDPWWPRDVARTVLDVVEEQMRVDREKSYAAGCADALIAYSDETGDLTLTNNDQANDCPHHSATGVDTAPTGPAKVWACDHCGLRWRTDGEKLL